MELNLSNKLKRSSGLFNNLKPSGDGLKFLNHFVHITGKNLRTLGLALQDRTVEFIKPLPERYSALFRDEAWIKAIEIENKKGQS